MKKYKAIWAGNTKKICKQLMVSIKSYILSPFYKRYDNATKEFFEKIYNKTKYDELIFDGNNDSYLDKAVELFENNPSFDLIYDCGCGNGSFIKFAKKNNIIYGKYIGIDFAIHNIEQTENIFFVNSRVETFDYRDASTSRLIVLCNVACYLSDNELIELLTKIKAVGTTLLLVDPIPGVFWDATFEHVRLYYRNPRQMLTIMKKNGFMVDEQAVDYLLNFGSTYYFPLSYAVKLSYKENT